MKYWLVILSFLFVGCSAIGTFHQTVPAGKHRSTLSLKFIGDDVLDYSFTTDSTWLWPVPDKNGYSKVVGIAYNSNHKNSVRVVYLRASDTIGVLAYYLYVNGVSPQDNPIQKGILDTISIGQSYHGRLGWDNGYYFVELNNKRHSMYVGDILPGIRFRTLSNLYVGGRYVLGEDWHTITTIR